MEHLLKKWIRTGIFCTGLLFFSGFGSAVEAGHREYGEPVVESEKRVR